MDNPITIEERKILKKYNSKTYWNTLRFNNKRFYVWVSTHRKDRSDKIRFESTNKKFPIGASASSVISDFYTTLIKKSLDYPDAITIPDLGEVGMKNAKKKGFSPLYKDGEYKMFTPFDYYMYYLFHFKVKFKRIRPELRSFMSSGYIEEYSREYINLGKKKFPDGKYYSAKFN
jgi:hypothetical protein